MRVYDLCKMEWALITTIWSWLINAFAVCYHCANSMRLTVWTQMKTRHTWNNIIRAIGANIWFCRSSMWVSSDSVVLSIHVSSLNVILNALLVLERLSFKSASCILGWFVADESILFLVRVTTHAPLTDTWWCFFQKIHLNLIVPSKLCCAARLSWQCYNNIVYKLHNETIIMRGGWQICYH